MHPDPGAVVQVLCFIATSTRLDVELDNLLKDPF